MDIIVRDTTTGLRKEVSTVSSSAGMSNAGAVPNLNSDGHLNQSLTPAYVGNAASDLVAGNWVYVKSDGTVDKASAAVSGHPATGFVLVASLTGQPAAVFRTGRNTSLSGLTAGTRYYLSTTAGLQTSMPVNGQGLGSFHQYLGTAYSATEIDYSGDDFLVKVA